MPLAGRTVLLGTCHSAKETGQSGWKNPSGSLPSFVAVLPIFSLLEKVSVSVESLSMGQWMRMLWFI